MACNRRVAATPSFPSPTSSLSRPLLEIDLGSLWMLTIGMQTGIGFSSHGPQCSEPLPARLTSLQKLGRFFRMAGKLGMNGQQRRKSGRVERVDVGAVATGENLPVLADPPKSSDETVRPEKDTGRRGHGGRQLHHSISTPALRSKNKQSPQRSAPEEDSPTKTLGPVVVSLLKDIHPSLSQRPKQKLVSPVASACLTETGSDDVTESPSSPETRKRSMSPSQQSADIDGSPNPGQKLASLQRPRPSTDSLDSSSSPRSPTFYPAYAQEVRLRSMASVDSGATTTTSEDGSRLAGENSTRRKSSKKLSRMLGGHQGSSFDLGKGTGESGEFSPPGSPSPSEHAFFFQASSDSLATGKAKIARRMSVTLSSLSSIPARLRPPLHVRRSSSSIPCIPDNISEASQELRDDAYAEEGSSSLISPISFNPDPPSPVCPLPFANPLTRPSLSNQSSTHHGASPHTPGLAPSPAVDPEPQTPIPAPPEPPVEKAVPPRSQPPQRPRSVSYAPPKDLSLLSSRLFGFGSGSGSSSSNPTTPTHTADTPIPVKANWLDSVRSVPSLLGRDRVMEVRQEETTVPRKSSAPDWSGQWNEEDMDKVIKKLRNLR